MGAAVEVFDGAVAIEVGRDRFLPVKTTNDLLVLRSDVYDLDDRYRFVARTDAPLVDLDPAHYKTIAAFDARFDDGTPSLRAARSLTVRGDWTFGSGVTVTGDAELPTRAAPRASPTARSSGRTESATDRGSTPDGRGRALVTRGRGVVLVLDGAWFAGGGRNGWWFGRAVPWVTVQLAVRASRRAAGSGATGTPEARGSPARPAGTVA